MVSGSNRGGSDREPRRVITVTSSPHPGQIQQPFRVAIQQQTKQPHLSTSTQLSARR